MICFLFAVAHGRSGNPKRRSHSSTGEIGESPSVAAADLAPRRIGAALPLPMGDTPRNVANAKGTWLACSCRKETSFVCSNRNQRKLRRRGKSVAVMTSEESPADAAKRLG
jgi:hypothetical protein